MQLNASRIKVLQAQDDVVNSMKEAAGKDLLNVSQHHHHHVYRELLKDLIVQVKILHVDGSVVHNCQHCDSVFCLDLCQDTNV